MKHFKRRKICVVTGTRAEYGLLFRLMKEIKGDPHLKLQTVVTGAHLSPQHGLTHRLIRADGFRIDATVNMHLADDDPVALANSFAHAVRGFAKAFQQLRPDIIVLYSDRYEMLAVAFAGLVSRIPMAHIGGGESTIGVIDEAIRHSLTKMAHLHFVTAEPYRTRVIQLGESPSRVFTVGAPGIDFLEGAHLMSRKRLEKSLGFKLGTTNFLVTYHPATLSKLPSSKAVDALLKALDHFPEAMIVFTRPNADTENHIIWDRICGYVKKNPERSRAYVSLGHLKYLSLMNQADVVIGNSSSGIVEAPALKKATVNVGNRQTGRLKATSIIDCRETSTAIILAIQKALGIKFRSSLPRTRSLYGTGRSAAKIRKILRSASLSELLTKKFFDLS